MSRLDRVRSPGSLLAEASPPPHDLADATSEMLGCLNDDAVLARAIGAFDESQRLAAMPRLTSLDVSQALALLEGRFVLVDRPATEPLPALVLAAYLAVLDRQAVHLMTEDDSDAGALVQRVGPVWWALGLTVGVLGSDRGVEGRRSVYASSVVVGSWERFCDDYLSDHLAVSQDKVVRARRDVAFLQGVNLLVDVAGGRRRLTLAQDDTPRARIWGDEFLGVYGRCAAALENWYPQLPLLLHRHRRSAWQCDAAGGLREVRGRRGARPPSGSHEPAAMLERAQREEMYGVMEQIMSARELRDVILTHFRTAIDDCLADESDDLGSAVRRCLALYRDDESVPTAVLEQISKDRAAAAEFLRRDVTKVYERRTRAWGDGNVVDFERRVLLTVMTMQWAAHLQRMGEAAPTPTKAHLLRGRAGREAELLSSNSARSGRLMHSTISREVLGYLLHAAP